MGPHNYKGANPAFVFKAHDDNPYSNRQNNASIGRPKDQDISQFNLATDPIGSGSGATASGTCKQNKTTPVKIIKLMTKSSGADLVAGNKRKHDRLGPSSEANPKKSRKLSQKEVNFRKAGLTKQLENIFDWSSRQPDSSSDNSRYTTEKVKRNKAELEDAISLFRSKIKREGQEEDFPNELFRVEGMCTAIRDYQVVGAGFMLRHERAHTDCPGGIVADDMGLGKTVQSIACILANPPSKKAKHERRSATLIIVPNQGLIKQWSEELELHADVDTAREVCKYTGGGKLSALGISTYPYLLATYSQVERDFRLHKSNNKKEVGPLFEANFFRIILDEGDNIRNYYGSTSKACGELKATLKWVLSGTPLRNGVRECLPYFRFLGIDVRGKAVDFNKKWGEPKTDSTEDRTMQILVQKMIRREVGQVFMGREMCKLPQSHIEERVLDITDDEAIISKHLEQALLRREEEEEKRDKNEKHDPHTPKSNYYVRCTRLRQAVDHPFLLESCMRDVLKREELEELVAELENVHLKSNPPKVKSESPCSVKSPGSQKQESSIYDMVIDIKSHLDDIISSHDNKGCLECFSVAELKELECGHVICRNCYDKLLHENIMEEKTRNKCPQCGKTVGFIVKEEEDPDTKRPPQRTPMKLTSEIRRTLGGRSVSVIPPSELKKRSLGDDHNGTQPRMSDSSCRWLNKCDKLGKITPSTKTTEAMGIVKEWQDKAPDDKIVIFTEWIATAKVLGRMLNKANLTFVYYNGDIPMKSRNKNLEDFKNNPDIKILVMSMGSGNVGLTIVAANRMIVMTPWWNYAAESQAFGRVKRHGQRKETYLVRLFARDTIDQRIFDLQRKKEEEIKEAMSQGRKPKPLSHAEKRWLMGDRNALEAPFVESDDESAKDDESNWSDSSTMEG
ncbi:hypothetical protein E0Z10_g7734 [Xylaria hypoxylon]|uniref:RING-type domain-containing protein n=1 Tax=Xylaria hypoxylon TaxID=37992 RepID=A0A4Z0YLM8_9PEZI|nr:hypothetical protein E0Z10_g7734 [Xylaria hypoxylon]